MLGYTWKIRGFVFLYNLAVIAIASALGATYAYAQGVPLFKPVLFMLLISYPLGQFLFPKVLNKHLKKK